MILAIIPCSNLKMPTPCPAWLMYSASGIFSQNYLVAKKNCNQVLILSGKYGLIEPEKIISSYNQKIDVKKEGLADKIKEKVQTYSPKTVISYCSSEYNKALYLLDYTEAVSGDMFQRTKQLGKAGSVKGNVFPLRASLEWMFEKKESTIEEFWSFCLNQWKHPITQKCQFNRLLKSPFVHLQGEKISYVFKEII